MRVVLKNAIYIALLLGFLAAILYAGTRFVKWVWTRGRQD